jgi:hypothetical protein
MVSGDLLRKMIGFESGNPSGALSEKEGIRVEKEGLLADGMELIEQLKGYDGRQKGVERPWMRYGPG